MVLLESKISLKTGDSAPGFLLMGIDDKMHSLDSYAESKGLLIIFICNHCPYVKAKIDAIKQIHEKFKENIALVGINSNDSRGGLIVQTGRILALHASGQGFKSPSVQFKKHQNYKTDYRSLASLKILDQLK